MAYTITIVGGGTAGWMTAALLSRFLDQSYTLQLIESDLIGTVGVGEATLPQLQLVNSALGLGEDAFMKATKATFKLGIEFVGWGAPDSRYIHAFGEIGRDMGLVPFHHYWLRARQRGHVCALDTFSLNAQAAFQNKFTRPSSGNAVGLARAYHLDAGLYGQLLRTLAQSQGVKRIEGKILTCHRSPVDGHVTGLQLDKGDIVPGDLFIDCSGFAGLLIEDALKTGFDDWSKWLPCDRAIAVACESAGVLTPYTRSTATKAGWRWRIPLQHRIGNGHVYCSRYMDDTQAEALLLSNLDGPPRASTRMIKFQAGKRKRFWNQNVVALGLASGFIEPLESTSIHLIQSGIERLLKFLPKGEIKASDVAEYNAQCDFEIERVRDFIILHYKLNQRDEPFWRDCRHMEIPDTLSQKIALFEANARIVRQNAELFAEVGWLQVMLGQGLKPLGYNPLADQPSEKELHDFLEILRQTISNQLVAMPDHAAFIAKYCRSES